MVRKSFFKKDYRDKDRRFRCSGGFGCNPSSAGRAVFGTFLLDGEEARIDRGDVEGIVAETSKQPRYEDEDGKLWNYNPASGEWDIPIEGANDPCKCACCIEYREASKAGHLAIRCHCRDYKPEERCDCKECLSELKCPDCGSPDRNKRIVVRQGTSLFFGPCQDQFHTQCYAKGYNEGQRC